jgi:hypothetical protein
MLLLSPFLFASPLLRGQDSTRIDVPKHLDADLITTVMGDTLKGKVRKVDEEFVTFYMLGERLKQKVQKNSLTSIIYKDGRVERFSNPLILKKESEGASKIKVTYSDEDVQVYRKIGVVEGYYTGSIRYAYSNGFLEKMAIMDAKERAYKNDPRVKILLIKNSNITRGYGDDPSAVVTAEVYYR